MASPGSLLSFWPLLVLAVVCLTSTCNALYEDQVGVRDWYELMPSFEIIEVAEEVRKLVTERNLAWFLEDFRFFPLAACDRLAE